MIILGDDVTIEGELFAPQSSASSPARLTIYSDGYRLSGLKGFGSASPPLETDMTGGLSDLRFEPKLGRGPRKIYTSDNYLFQTHDHEAVESIEGAKSGLWSKLSRLESFGPHLIPVAIITPIAAFALYRLMIPLIISFAMFMTPPALVTQIDRSTVKTLDLIIMDETRLDQEQQDSVTAIFAELTVSAQQSSERSSRTPDYQLLFRDSELGPNALALPGGTVVVTDDLITMFPDSPHVIAAVLAHEIGHVEHEHSLRQLYRSLGIAAMIGFIAGDAGPILEELVLEGSAMLSLSFSRKHEMEADNYSFDLLTGMDQQADGLIDFFEKIKEEYPSLELSEWTMTHPLSDKRIENIETRLNEERTH